MVVEERILANHMYAAFYLLCGYSRVQLNRWLRNRHMHLPDVLNVAWEVFGERGGNGATFE